MHWICTASSSGVRNSCGLGPLSAVPRVAHALLAIRFLLALFGANPANGFADFIYTCSHPFVTPFFGLFSYRERLGIGRFEYETLIAIVVYAGVMELLARLVTIGSRRPA